jgi:acyl carrier protein
LTAESNSNNLLPSQILEDILMELQEKVIKLVSEATKMDAANISLNTSFVEDLNLDSLDMVELMMKMEDEFGVEIPEDETENLKSIGDVVTYLKTKSH